MNTDRQTHAVASRLEVCDQHLQIFCRTTTDRYSPYYVFGFELNRKRKVHNDPLPPIRRQTDVTMDVRHPVDPAQSTVSPTATATDFDLSDSDIEDFLEWKNLEYVSALAPTVAHLAVLAAAGLAGNTLVFLVYYRSYKRSSTRAYILTMCVCDLIVNSLIIPSSIVRIRFKYSFHYPAACKFIETISHVMGFMAGYLLVAIALDRQRTVSNSTRKPHRLADVRVVLPACVAVAVLSSLPMTVHAGSQTVRFPGTNVTGTFCSVADEYVHSQTVFAYSITKLLIFTSSILAIMLSYGRIAVHIRRHNKQMMVSQAALSRTDMGSEQPSSSGIVLEEVPSLVQDEEDDSTRDREGEDDAARDREGEDPSQLQPRNEVSLFSAFLSASSTTVQSEAITEPKPSAGDLTMGHMSPQLTTTPSSKHHGNSASRTSIRQAKASQGKTTQETAPMGIRHSSIDLSAEHKSLWNLLLGLKSKTKLDSIPKSSVRKIPTRTTFMMVVLAIMFFINYVPYLVVSLLFEGTNPHDKEFWANNLYNMAYRSVLINSATNPIVYSFCSSIFRKECGKLFSSSKNWPKNYF